MKNWRIPVLIGTLVLALAGGIASWKLGMFDDLGITLGSDFKWPWQTENSDWQKFVNYHYFNDDVSAISPHHFGPDRYQQFQNVKDDSTAKNYNSEHEYLVYWTRTNFYSSIEYDPCLAAGCIYYAQTVTGENFLGTLQGSTDEEKANYAHQLMRTNSAYWQSAVTSFEEYLNKNFSFNVVDIDGEYVASSYMLPDSASFDSGAPKLVWESSSNRDGHWFELTKLDNKDSGSIKLRYRMECGYQFPTTGFTSGSTGGTGDPSPISTPAPTAAPTPVPTENPGTKNPEAGSYPRGNAPIGGHDENNTHYEYDAYQPTEPPVPVDTIITSQGSTVVSTPAPVSSQPDSTGAYFESQTVTTADVEQSTAVDSSGNTIVVSDDTVISGTIAIPD